MKNKIILRIVIITSSLFIFFYTQNTYNKTTTKHLQINSSIAYDHIQTQLSLGPRIYGELGHTNIINWIHQTLTDDGFNVIVQYKQNNNILLSNIYSETGQGRPWILIGAHYDTRQYADKDPILTNRNKPVPGANDGASSVAILLELARNIHLKQNRFQNRKFTFVFFDAEDNGGINNQEWIQGSTFYADSLGNNPENYPDYVIILDMVGDKDLQIIYELNSDVALSEEIWAIAKDLGYQDYFISQEKYRIIDDHIPFVQLGIPSLDIIDLDYPYWHTTDDTIDKIDPNSLQIVGDTILNWLLTKSGK